MFGNTHAIADAVGKGLEPMHEVVVVSLAEAGRERSSDADLLVVGGPTHFRGANYPLTGSSCLREKQPSRIGTRTVVP